MDPGLLVLDEPTTGQDRPGLARVEAVLSGLREAGRTIVAVTHDLELARRSFDRVIGMRAGEIVGDGPPSAVL
jgi:energy-coupling factor transport system ATP-binding protein